MYGKYSGYRIGFITISIIGGFSLALYLHKFRFRPIKGSVISSEVDHFLLKNDKFKKILNEKSNKNSIKLSNLY